MDRIVDQDGSASQTVTEVPAAQFRQLADCAPVMIWRSDLSQGCDFFNRPWLEFTGRNLEQELGLGWLEGVHPEDQARCLGIYREAFAARRPFTMDYRLRRHDGAWRWVLDMGQPCHAADGRFTGFIGSCTDITEVRQAQTERHTALQDRETLLNELQHRVKNNTQATTSFLALQANRAADPAVATALRGAAVRVALASRVQDRMFRLEDQAAGVALGEELEAAARAALEATGRPGLVLDTRCEPALRLPARQATPLALIVNELVVNAARHAFPDGRSGRISLSVARGPDGRIEIRIADDGVGLPDAVRQQVPRHCLGLHLIYRLARQARAIPRLEAPPGTRWVLTLRPA